MKHITYFQEFLSKEVNLNETRLQRLNTSSSAVDEFLSGNLDSYEKTERQGSYGLKTIIKPVGTREYDADMLLYVTYDEDKEPKDYINDVYNCLKGNDNYKDKVHRRTSVPSSFKLGVIRICLKRCPCVRICDIPQGGQTWKRNMSWN